MNNNRLYSQKSRYKAPRLNSDKHMFEDENMCFTQNNFYNVLDKASKMISSTKWQLDKFTFQKQMPNPDHSSRHGRSYNWRQAFNQSQNIVQTQPPSKRQKSEGEKVTVVAQPKIRHDFGLSTQYNHPSEETRYHKPLAQQLASFIPQEANVSLMIFEESNNVK